MKWPIQSMNQQHGMTRLETIVVIVVIGTLAALVIPNFFKVIGHDGFTHDLSTAKMLHERLLAYANDHNGRYPYLNAESTLPKNANEVFRLLVPEYINDKRYFLARRSPWTPHFLLNDYSVIPGVTPRAGQNAWAYVTNLSIRDNPRLPIIASGFARGTPGTYSPEFLPGGYSRDKNLISTAFKHPKSKHFWTVVIRNDGSGRIERVSSDYRLYEERAPAKKIDLFKPSQDWLRSDQVPLNPEA